MRICIFSMLFAAVGLLAGCSTPTGHISASSTDSDALAALRKELQQTQAQLDQLTARTTRLEQKVRALELSNAELQQEVRRLQVPHWGYPQTNQGPHLTPLQAK